MAELKKKTKTTTTKSKTDSLADRVGFGMVWSALASTWLISRFCVCVDLPEEEGAHRPKLANSSRYAVLQQRNHSCAHCLNARKQYLDNTRPVSLSFLSLCVSHFLRFAKERVSARSPRRSALKSKTGHESKYCLVAYYRFFVGFSRTIKKREQQQAGDHRPKENLRRMQLPT